MNLTYLGHSSFLIEAKGTRIVTDPFGAIGFAFPSVSADLVTVSHGHYDHCNVRDVGGTPEALCKAGSYKRGGVRLTAIPSFHDGVHGMRRGNNLIFRYEAEGLSLCHLGDIGKPCSAELIEQIGKVDILLIPVGGNYTIDALAAKEYVKCISPKIAIPMHYKTKDLQIDIGGVEPFAELFQGEREVIRAGSRLEFSREEIQQSNQKIVIMERI